MTHRAVAGGLASALVLSLLACSGGDRQQPRAAGPEPLTTRAAVAAAPDPGQELARRPDLLVVETDDMRADDLRFMPQTRRWFARNGLTFANSFAPNPLCCPSRASLLTGRYSHNHRVLTHEAPYGFTSFDDRDTLATRLQGAGYRTGMVGKYLNGYGERPTRTGRDSLTYVPPGWDDWWGASDHVWGPGERFGGGTYDYFRLTSNVNGRIQSWPGRYSTEVTADQTAAMVGRFERGRKPWFVWWNPTAPHHGGPVEPDDPGVVPRSDGFPTRWVTPARPAWVKGRFDTVVRNGAGTPPRRDAEGDISDKPGFLRSYPPFTAREREVVRDVTRQRAEALYVLDRRLGRMLRALRASGRLSSTLVVLTSDNGYYLGEHRKRQGKINLHEPSIRVPLLMAGAGVPRGRRYDPVTTVDLATTLAAWAGTGLKRADGVDLRPLLRDGDRGWRRPVVLEGLMPEGRYVRAARRPGWGRRLDTIGVRLGRWKLVRYSTGEGELYDLARDPLELRNLYRKPGAKQVRRQLVKVWRRASACRAAGCRVLLPAELQVDAAEVRRITLAQQRAERRHFGR
ncbi:sulfatase [Nocardioides sp. SYSU D00038]|uniref:sulfatase family protein n=1 Tax=Nocardioides sp. SYSU D00038 TaxID=2812554 RepID=UPI0019681EA2|nr:sulfatase [Nocardioides sp. SYSU D00038]